MNGIVCMSFDKKRLVTGGMDRTVRVWDIRSGTNIHKFCGHKVTTVGVCGQTSSMELYSFMVH